MLPKPITQYKSLLLIIYVGLATACSQQASLKLQPPGITAQSYRTALAQRESLMQQAYNQLIYEVEEYPGSELNSGLQSDLHPELRTAILLQQISDIKQAQADLVSHFNKYGRFLQLRRQALGHFKLDSKSRLAVLGALHAGDTRFARVYFQKKLAEDKHNNAEIHYELGQYFLSQFDYLRAFNHLHKATRLEPSKRRYQNAIQHLALKFAVPLRDNEVYLWELSNAKSIVEINTVTSMLTYIGRYWFSQQQYNKALRYFTRSLMLNTKTYGLKHPQYADTLIDLSQTFIRQNKLNSAMEFAKKAQAIVGNKEIIDEALSSLSQDPPYARDNALGL